MTDLYSKLKQKVVGRPYVKKVIKNIGWLSFDRIFQIVVSLFVGVWIARYLGPSDFGLMSFVIAIGAILSPFIGLGISNLLIREIISHPKLKYSLIGTTFWVNLLTSLLAALVMNLSVWIIKPGNIEVSLVMLVHSVGYVVSSLGILSCWFEAKVESRKVVVSRNVALFLSSVVRVWLLVAGFPVLFFVAASVFEILFNSTLLVYYYVKEKQDILKWKFSFGLAKKLFYSSWPLMLSGAMVLVYLRIDQVMIGMMLDETQVGIYSVAIKIAELFVFIPGAICISLFPALMLAKKESLERYSSRLQRFFDLMTWLPMSYIIPVSLFSSFIVVFLYGAEYAAAGPVLMVSVWSALGVSIKFALERYLIIENKTRIMFFNALAGAVTNICLNLVLIPSFGIMGASFATLISYVASAYLSLLVFPKTRPVFFMLLKSFWLPRIVSGLFRQIK
ncbi:MAG: flippase [archaeon]